MLKRVEVITGLEWLQENLVLASCLPFLVEIWTGWAVHYEALWLVLMFAGIRFLGCLFLWLRMETNPTAVSVVLFLAPTSYRCHG